MKLTCHGRIKSYIFYSILFYSILFFIFINAWITILIQIILYTIYYILYLLLVSCNYDMIIKQIRIRWYNYIDIRTYNNRQQLSLPHGAHGRMAAVLGSVLQRADREELRGNGPKWKGKFLAKCISLSFGLVLSLAQHVSNQ